MNAGALEAVDRIVNRGGAREEVLEAVLDVLVARGVVGSADVQAGRLRVSDVRDAETLARVELLVSHYAGGAAWSP